jgi:hypothetical protein
MGKPEVKRPLTRTRCKCENNLKVDKKRNTVINTSSS